MIYLIGMADAVRGVAAVAERHHRRWRDKAKPGNDGKRHRHTETKP
jgi:hypothetical protein